MVSSLHCVAVKGLSRVSVTMWRMAGVGAVVLLCGNHLQGEEGSKGGVKEGGSEREKIDLV